MNFIAPRILDGSGWIEFCLIAQRLKCVSNISHVLLSIGNIPGDSGKHRVFNEPYFGEKWLGSSFVPGGPK